MLQEKFPYPGGTFEEKGESGCLVFFTVDMSRSQFFIFLYSARMLDRSGFDHP